MASINRVFIMGNLGQDPELRYTQNQVPVVTLNIATTESWSKKTDKNKNKLSGTESLFGTARRKLCKIPE